MCKQNAKMNLIIAGGASDASLPAECSLDDTQHPRDSRDHYPQACASSCCSSSSSRSSPRRVPPAEVAEAVKIMMPAPLKPRPHPRLRLRCHALHGWAGACEDSPSPIARDIPPLMRLPLA